MKHLMIFLLVFAAGIGCFRDAKDTDSTTLAMLLLTMGSDITGILDTTFNSTGYATHDNAAGGGESDSVSDLVIDSQGRIVMCGNSNKGSQDNDIVVWRYNPDGTLDTTFNGTGFVIHQNAGGGADRMDAAKALTLDDDGNIVVCGASWNASGFYDIVVWRFEPDGDLDSTFDGDGFAVESYPAGGTLHDSASDIVIDSSGKIFVTGDSYNAGGNTDMVVLCFDDTGTLDASFDGDGIFVHGNAAGGDGHDGGESILIDGSGRLLICGHSDASTARDIVLWRMTKTGVLDSTFDSDGIVIIDDTVIDDSYDTGKDAVLDGSGNILVSASGYNSDGYYQGVICRLTSGGALDSTFGTDGIVTMVNPAETNETVRFNSITIDSNGRIVVAGYYDSIEGDAGPMNPNANDSAMLLARYTASGTPDTGFGQSGYVTFNSSITGDDEGWSLVIDGSGKILVGGFCTIETDNTAATVWRYR